MRKTIFTILTILLTNFFLKAQSNLVKENFIIEVKHNLVNNIYLPYGSNTFKNEKLQIHINIPKNILDTIDSSTFNTTVQKTDDLPELVTNHVLVLNDSLYHIQKESKVQKDSNDLYFSEHTITLFGNEQITEKQVLFITIFFTFKDKKGKECKISTNTSLKIMPQVNKIIESISEDTINIGKFYIKSKKPIEIYKKGKKDEGSKDKIESIAITIKDYSINEIIVKTEKFKFSNRIIPIPLGIYDKFHNFKLKNTKENIYILLGDVLGFDKDLNNHYSYFDTKLPVLYNLPKKDTVNIKENIGINSILNVKIFSDLTALLGEEPNGVAQLEVDTRIPFNVSPIKLKSYKKSFSSSRVFLLRYLQPYLILVKLRNKEESVQAIATTDSVFVKNDTTILDSIDYFRLYQQSWSHIGLNMNLIHLRLAKHIDVDLNVIGQYSFGNIKTSKDVLIEGGLLSYGGELKFYINPIENFGFEFAVKYSKIHPIQRENFKGGFFDTEINHISPTMGLYYHPLKNKNNSIFVRFKYYSTYKTQYNDFHQLQIGYKTLIAYGKK